VGEIPDVASVRRRQACRDHEVLSHRHSGAVRRARRQRRRRHHAPNLLARTVRTGNWIVEAKLDVANGGPAAPADACGLVQGTTVLDSAGVSLDGGGSPPDIETVALSGVVKSSAKSTTVGLRCAARAGERVIAQHMRITALQVTTITGP
jgi:hypothetical protein